MIEPEAAPTLGASERSACERCGTFAELGEYDGHDICQECVSRLSEIEREPPTVGNLLSGSIWVLSRIGVTAALIVALADLPIVCVEIFLPELPSFVSTAWGATVSIVAQGAVLSLAHAAIRGKELSIGEALKRSLDAAGRLIPTNLWAGIQVVLLCFLLIVPGIVRGLSLAMVLPIALHEGVSGSTAINRSVERMKGIRLTALTAYLAWGVVWMTGLAAYLAFSFALETPMLMDTPDWFAYGTLLAAGVLLPVLMVPVTCTTAVLYAKTLEYRIY